MMVYRIFFCLLFSALISSSEAATAAEAQALVTWKSSLSEADPLSSWRNSNVRNLCNWTGIVCDNLNSLTAINLTNLGLSGTLDSFNFRAFLDLTSLDLSSNSLTGQIPPSIGSQHYHCEGVLAVCLQHGPNECFFKTVEACAIEAWQI